MIAGPRLADTSRRRVVITGMGVIAPNGRDLETFWESVRSGQSAAGPLTRFDPSDSPSILAAEVRDWNPAAYMDAKIARRTERSLQYALASALMAVRDAKLDLGKVDPDRVGLVEGTSLSNLEIAYRAKATLDERGIRAFGPTTMLLGYVGSRSAEIAQIIGLRGHSLTCSSSSSSGNDALGYALHMIRHEEVDVMLAGAAEAPLVDTVYFGFAKSHAMSRWSGHPSEAMKPFDENGDGFVMGEGAAFLVLEELSHALGRGARIYAEVLGQGRSCEAYHPFAPQADGWGVARAIEKALREAKIDPAEIDYINPHGTANELNDIAEIRGIKTALGPSAWRVAISSTKPVTGHPLAAAGAVEAVICALVVSRAEIPASLNLTNPRPECDLDIVRPSSRPYPVRTALSLNSGLGGKNSCIIISRYPR